MKIETWNKCESPRLMDPSTIITEFKITTRDPIDNTKDFLAYIEAYDKDLDIAKMKATYDRDVQSHDFWRGYSKEDIIDVLDSIFLTADKTAVENKDNLRLKTRISLDKINAGIQILRDHYGIFYKPYPKPVKEEYDKDPWPGTGIHSLPDE